MGSPNKTIAIEPSFSEKELEKAARGRINNQTELYRSLVRALKRRRGFGILFLQCAPAKGKEIFSKLQTDLPQKRVGRLTLSEPIENLKALVEAREDLDGLNVLFVEGVEHSLSPYIKSEIGRNDYYKLEVLPPILNHLNLHRENFRNQFRHLCLVFVVPPFALKYFMYRAVDFFSWHSGVWTFSPPEEKLAKDTAQALDSRYSEYLALSDETRLKKILSLRNLIDLQHQTSEQRARLFVELSWVLSSAQDFDLALNCCEEAISLQPKNPDAWYSRGNTLADLSRNEEAIAAYNATLLIKPDYHEAFSNKGIVLSALGRREEAIAAYDAALAIKPDKHKAFSSKGIALSALGRKEEAIVAYDAALAIKPDYHEAFYNKGIALSALGRREEAIAAYDAALAIKPNYYEALSNKGIVLSALGREEEAIAAYDAALAIEPDDPDAHYNKACSYALSLQINDAITFLQKAIELDGTDENIELAKTDSDFDAIRDRPQFQALLAQYEQRQHSAE